MRNCVECEKWNEREIYFDEKGRVKSASYSKDKEGKTVMKTALKIGVIVEDGVGITEEELKEVMKKVDAIRDEQPLTEAHLIIKC